MPYRRRRQLWISRSNEASANSRREQQVRWAIILDWPGLEYQVYPAKITRSVTNAFIKFTRGAVMTVGNKSLHFGA